MFEILTLLSGIVLVQISPGPNMLAVASSSLAGNRGAGLATACGIASAVLIWSALFAVGVGGLFVSYPSLVNIMRLLGGSYLLYLGFRAIRAAFAEKAGIVVERMTPPQLRSAYRKGLLVNLTNPKSALMWVAISVFLGANGIGIAKMLALGGLAASSALLIYSLYAMLFSSGVAVQSYRRGFTLVETAFGGVFGSLGAKLLLDAVREFGLDWL